MVASRPESADILTRTPARRLRRRLVRCIPAPRFLTEVLLHTSSPLDAQIAQPERRRVSVPFSETDSVANIESRRSFQGSNIASEPEPTYVADVDLRRIVDPEKPDVRKALGLLMSDLFEPWRGVPSPTQLQELGSAISRQTRISAIRYPSDACRQCWHQGVEPGEFPGAIVAPSRLRILGRSGFS